MTKTKTFEILKKLEIELFLLTTIIMVIFRCVITVPIVNIIWD